MKLTKDRNTPMQYIGRLSLPVEANAVIFAGSLVAVNAAGNAVPGATSTTLKAAGRAHVYVNNQNGAAGAVSILVDRGAAFKFANDTTDPVTAASLLGTCYIVDDQTVAATNGTNTRSAAGKVVSVESDGVWVEML